MTPAQAENMDNNSLDRVTVLRDRFKVPPLPFQTMKDIDRSLAAKRWIFKGVMALGETSAWIGPPGSMKSALLAGASDAAARGVDWHGHKSKLRCGVVYFALERADLVRRRLMAHETRSGDAEPVPVAIVARTINMMNPQAVPQIQSTILNAEIVLGIKVGLVIFDTFPKLIAAGGGDEDKARDQGIVFANIQRIKDEIPDIHIALIGHTGKDEGRGARGSNAILGDCDVMVQISGGDSLRTVTVTKANDQAEGPLFSFASEIHKFGVDEDGDPDTVNVAVPAEGVAMSAQKSGRLTKGAQIALNALTDAILEQGRTPPANEHIPEGTKAVTLEQWRAMAYLRGISTSNEDRARQQAFKRSSEYLIGASRVGFWDEWVWLAG